MNRKFPLAVLFLLPSLVSASESVPPGWSAESPRDEIRPEFAWDPSGGPDGKGELVISADDREGLAGSWTSRIKVTGGKTYRF